MNGDPYARNSQASDRRVINRSGSAASPAYRSPEESGASTQEPPTAAPRSSSAASPRGNAPHKSRKGLVWGIIITLLVIGLGITGWLVWSSSKNGETGIDASRYQAVFMANGQIYFGKLTTFNDESFRITKVYYPQTQNSDSEESSTTNQGNIQLFPITEGVHGPEDEMIINKQQILYYENLRADSKVTQLIEQNSK